MKRLRLLAVLLWGALPASAQVTRAVLPSIGPAVGGFAGAPSATIAPSALGAVPNLSAPALLSPALLPAAVAPAPEAAASIPAAAAPAIPALAGTETGLIQSRSVPEGLGALRAASHPLHAQVEEIVARIKSARPELPISPENLFLVRDLSILQELGIPEEAGGAARIVTDGRTEVPVVILAAARPIGVDNFVEFAVHEAVHLMDDGILRVRHDEELKHFFAEGWTQKRAVTMANEVLAGLGRPETPGKAYHKEIAMVDAFIARFGTDALDELVRTGSDAGMRAALGARWDLAGRIVSSDGGKRAPREARLDALIALVQAPSIGPAEERALLEHVRR